MLERRCPGRVGLSRVGRSARPPRPGWGPCIVLRAVLQRRSADRGGTRRDPEACRDRDHVGASQQGRRMGLFAPGEGRAVVRPGRPGEESGRKAASHIAEARPCSERGARQANRPARERRAFTPPPAPPLGPRAAGLVAASCSRVEHTAPPCIALSVSLVECFPIFSRHVVYGLPLGCPRVAYEMVAACICIRSYWRS